jgi:hypothetical protein
MTDQEQESDNTNHGSTRVSHRRNGSVPSNRASISLSQLERGWSTGNHSFLPHESLSTTSTGLHDSFAEHWASGSFSTNIADFPRRASTTSVIPLAPHSFHRSMGPISDTAAPTLGRETEQMLKSVTDENAISVSFTTKLVWCNGYGLNCARHTPITRKMQDLMGGQTSTSRW